MKTMAKMMEVLISCILVYSSGTIRAWETDKSDRLTNILITKKSGRVHGEAFQNDHPADDVKEKFDCPADEGMFPDVYNCSRFYICLEDKPELKLCPPNKQFSVIYKFCVPLEYSGCIEKSKGDSYDPTYICPLPNGLFTNHKDCSSFYHCSNGYGYLKKCPDGLQWSTRFQRCEWPIIADCTEATGKNFFMKYGI